MDYLVILEKAENSNWSAYSPDVMGCFATGETIEETLEEYESVLRMHLKGLEEDELPLPKPSAQVRYISISITEND
jgi:predicted RNase H-like HicB family nuclease